MKNKVLLVNNGKHVGIAAVGQAYRKAFEFLGVPFNYLEMHQYPKLSVDEMNFRVKGFLCDRHYDIVIMIQPTYLYSTTVQYLSQMKTRFISIQTEDPYSLSGIMQASSLFDMKFTNEKVVAMRFGQMGFYYLPVAFDSLQPFKLEDKKEFDLSYLCTYYPNRLEYLEQLSQLKDRKLFVGGNVNYAMLKDLPMNMSRFTAPPGLIARYKEYEIYSKSKFVLNPHRPPSVVGITDFNAPNKECKMMLDLAASPNPRFFEAIGCGAMPVSDVSRTECLKLIRLHAGNLYDSKILYSIMNPFVENINQMISDWDRYIYLVKELQCQFMAHETYVVRSQQLLNVVGI